MFLFTLRVRTEGGTPKLASTASPHVAPKLPAGKPWEGPEGPRGWCGVSGHMEDLRWAQGGALSTAGPAGG